VKEIEIYYFETGEFQNPKNLKDVLGTFGEKSELETSIRDDIRTYAEVMNQDWKDNEILDEEIYVLEDDAAAEYLETEKGIFVASDSNILDQETDSLESRSSKCIVNGDS
jgi:hypothetical protein